MNKRKRLTKNQREALLSWIGEGLETDEINKRAAKWRRPFKVTRPQVAHYRTTRQVDLNGIKENGEFNALTTGLAKREERVGRLQKLADLLIADLFDNQLLWTDEVKSIGGADNFERIDYKEFNTAEVAQLRGVLEDIAHEMGDRRNGVVVNNTFQLDMNEWKKVRSKRLADVKKIEE